MQARHGGAMGGTDALLLKRKSPAMLMHRGASCLAESL
jgi:hypothetical protein